MNVKDVTPKEAANFVAEAVDRGVNYFDVAPIMAMPINVLVRP